LLYLTTECHLLYFQTYQWLCSQTVHPEKTDVILLLKQSKLKHSAHHCSYYPVPGLYKILREYSTSTNSDVEVKMLQRTKDHLDKNSSVPRQSKFWYQLPVGDYSNEIKSLGHDWPDSKMS